MLVIKGARVTTASGPSEVGANLDVPEGAEVIDGSRVEKVFINGEVVYQRA